MKIIEKKREEKRRMKKGKKREINEEDIFVKRKRISLISLLVVEVDVRFP